MNPGDLKDYAWKIKKKTGTGGSVKNGIIELQGDFQEKIRTILSKDGWEVKWRISNKIFDDSYWNRGNLSCSKRYLENHPIFS